jgi:hypothetical protein
LELQDFERRLNACGVPTLDAVRASATAAAAANNFTDQKHSLHRNHGITTAARLLPREYAATATPRTADAIDTVASLLSSSSGTRSPFITSYLMKSRVQHSALPAALAEHAPLPSSALPVVRVGGVPEHFNYSWHIAIERKLFESAGVHVQWVEIKEGTGAMIQQLKDEKVDLIIALTEGLVSEIAKNIQSIDQKTMHATTAASDSKSATAATAIAKPPESELCLLSTYVESPLTWAISTVDDTGDCGDCCIALNCYALCVGLLTLISSAVSCLGW